MPLDIWFRALWPRAASDGGIFERAATTAHSLLATGQDTVVLHGDYHHDNVLDGGARGHHEREPRTGPDPVQRRIHWAAMTGRI